MTLAPHMANLIAIFALGQLMRATGPDAALDALRGLRVDATPPRGLGQEFRLAQTHGLTAYDAADLAVAFATGTS